MLSWFDWLRRSRSGAELVATLKLLAEMRDCSLEGQGLGAPQSALAGPCTRCYIYPAQPHRDRQNRLCWFCAKVVARAGRLIHVSRRAVAIWGFVTQLPKQFHQQALAPNRNLVASYVHDDNRFLVLLRRRALRSWLQDLALYHGTVLKGVFQTFPTMGAGRQLGMGDVLCWAIHNETALPMDRWRVQFYSAAYQLPNRRFRDRRGLLTYEISEFLRLLEMAEVFRAQLRPYEQKQLYELLTLNDAKEEQFYWGRFLGMVSQEARDMLTAWRIRQWPKNRVKQLYELIDYVALPDSR